MNPLNIFTLLYTDIVVQLMAAVAATATNLATALRMPLVLAVTIWLAGTTAIELLSPGGGEPLMSFVRKCVRAVFVLGLATAASYTAVFVTFVLNTLPNELTSAIAGAQTVSAASAHAFDIMLADGWAGVTSITKNMSAWDPKTLILGVLSIILFGIGAILIAISFLVFLATQIALGMSITVGPIFIGFLLAEKTVGYFVAWFNVVFARVMTMAQVVAVLTVLMPVTQGLAKNIMALNAPGGGAGNDLGAQVSNIVAGLIVYVAVAYFTNKAEALAQSMTAAAAPTVSGIANAAHSALSRTASTAAGAAGSAARAVGSAAGRAAAAGMRSITPAGRAP